MKESKAITTSIKATSRASIKVRTKNGSENYYTVEYSEERSIPTDIEVDMDFERSTLWKDVNDVVDDQCEQILKTFK